MADSDLQIKGGGGGGGGGVLGASVWSKDKGEGVGGGASLYPPLPLVEPG